MSNRSLKNDLAFGLSNEEPVRLLLKKIFKDDEEIMNTKDLYNNKYCSYDFEGLTTHRKFELKSRTFNKSKYPTTILPVHKINDDITKNEYILVFKFLDKCCYIKYDKDLFNTFSKRHIQVYRCDKRDLPTLHFEIPVKLLIDIE